MCRIKAVEKLCWIAASPMARRPSLPRHARSARYNTRSPSTRTSPGDNFSRSMESPRSEKARQKETPFLPVS
ncbi:hypothetical protein VTH06DRAFT_5514 [Thermothelomyces fergusii]